MIHKDISSIAAAEEETPRLHPYHSKEEPIPDQQQRTSMHQIIKKLHHPDYHHQGKTTIPSTKAKRTRPSQKNDHKTINKEQPSGLQQGVVTKPYDVSFNC